MAGLHVDTALGQVTYTNNLTGDNFLELEYRMSSADASQDGIEKVRRISDVVGTIDFTLDTLGKRVMLKFSTMGNYQGIFGLAARIPAYGTQKFSHADVVNATGNNANVVVSAVVPYTVKARTTFTAGLADTETCSLGGLTFTASGAVSVAELVSLWADIADTTPATALPVSSLGSWSGTLQGYSTFTDGTSLSSILVQARTVTATINSFPFTGDATGTSLVLEEAPSILNSTTCIGKLSTTNLGGFAFNRFLTTCESGWSKAATQGELTVTITEGAADTLYEPENLIGIPHRIRLVYGADAYGKLVYMDIDKVTLQSVSAGTLADFKAQDLKFMVTGQTTLTLS
jgi:hypothetical protein